MSLHPATPLILWLGFACCLPLLEMRALAVMTAVVLMLCVLPGVAARAWLLLRRTGILLAALMLFYGLGTPGTPWVEGLGLTREGMSAGGMQAWRIALMLMSLAVVLVTLGRDGLMAGLYRLLVPLRYLGVPVERFVARLALTLEMLQRMPATDWSPTQLKRALHAPPALDAGVIELDIPRATWRDTVAILLGISFCGALLW